MASSSASSATSSFLIPHSSFLIPHSRPQRPRSFWSALKITTSGQVQRHSRFEWLCKHNRLRPEPIRFVRLDSEHAQSKGKSVNRGLPDFRSWTSLLLRGSGGVDPLSNVSAGTDFAPAVHFAQRIDMTNAWTSAEERGVGPGQRLAGGQPEVVIFSADQTDRGLWGRECDFLVCRDRAEKPLIGWAIWRNCQDSAPARFVQNGGRPPGSRMREA